MKIEWDIHHSADEPVSYHTHGLDKFDSLDIEIALPLSPHEGVNYCNSIAALIRDGLKAEDGLMVDGIFNLPVFFFKTMPLHGDTEVFRVVFPDEKGFYPWDMQGCTRCDEPYKSQIFFEKDKAFWVEISDCERVESHKNVGARLFDGFEKRNSIYTRPVMYYVGGDEDGLVRVPPYMNETRALQKCYQNMQMWGGIDPADIKIICRDLDSSDPLNQSFFEWKERYW